MYMQKIGTRALNCSPEKNCIYIQRYDHNTTASGEVVYVEKKKTTKKRL